MKAQLEDLIEDIKYRIKKTEIETMILDAERQALIDVRLRVEEILDKQTPDNSEQE